MKPAGARGGRKAKEGYGAKGIWAFAPKTLHWGIGRLLAVRGQDGTGAKGIIRAGLIPDGMGSAG